MNEATFLLSILVNKEVLTLREAKALQKSLSEGYVNANLAQMTDKVSKALEVNKPDLEVVDANTILK